MVIPGARNFNGASKKLIPATNPLQKIIQKQRIYFFILYKYLLKRLEKNDMYQKMVIICITLTLIYRN